MDVSTPTLALAAVLALAALLAWRARSRQVLRGGGAAAGAAAGRAAGAFDASQLESRAAEGFRALLSPGAGEGFVVVSSGEFYVQAARREDGRVWMEAVSNHYLPEAQRLDPAGEGALEALGFSPPGRESDNFTALLGGDLADPASLASLTARVFGEVYRVPSRGTFRVEVELDS